MQLRRVIVVLPLLFLLLGNVQCRSGASLGPEESVTFRTLVDADGAGLKGTQSGILAEQLVVIRSDDDLKDLWERHASFRSPLPAEPPVDFDNEMVIAVFAGEHATGGYDIEVTDVRQNDEFIIADIEFTKPGADCDVTQAQAQAFHFVVFDAIDKPVNFTQTTTVTDCTQ